MKTELMAGLRVRAFLFCLAFALPGLTIASNKSDADFVLICEALVNKGWKKTQQANRNDIVKAAFEKQDSRLHNVIRISVVENNGKAKDIPSFLREVCRGRRLSKQLINNIDAQGLEIATIQTFEARKFGIIISILTNRKFPQLYLHAELLHHEEVKSMAKALQYLDEVLVNLITVMHIDLKNVIFLNQGMIELQKGRGGVVFDPALM